METQCACHDAESRRLGHQPVLMRVLMRFVGPETQIMDGKIKRVAPLPSLRS